MVILVERVGAGTSDEPYRAAIEKDKTWRIVSELENGYEIEVYEDVALL